MKKPSGLIFILFLGLGLQFGCSSLISHLIDTPKIEKKEIKVVALDFSKILLSIELLIFNPNSRDLPLENLKADLEINGQAFLSKTWSELPVLRGNEKTLVKLPLTLEWKQILNVGIKMTQLNSIPYHIKGSVRLKGFDIPFDEKGEFGLKGP